MTDAVLAALARNKTAAGLIKLKIGNSQHVTEQGLVAVLSVATQLQELILEDLSPAITGTFLMLLVRPESTIRCVVTRLWRSLACLPCRAITTCNTNLYHTCMGDMQ